MTVMVDELRVYPNAKHRCFREGSAHLMTDADTLDELHAFAARLGLRRSWFQPRSSPHYDLSPAKHALALKLGAKLVPAREQAIARVARRNAAPSSTDRRNAVPFCTDSALSGSELMTQADEEREPGGTPLTIIPARSRDGTVLCPGCDLPQHKGMCKDALRAAKGLAPVRWQP